MSGWLEYDGIELTPEGALETILGNLPAPAAAEKPLHEAAGFILAEDVRCDIDMPPFDRSAMDGYALAGAFDSYRLTAEIPAGAAHPEPLTPGRAAPIMTGAPVPPGADRVLMLEKAALEDGRIVPGAPTGEGDNICRQGQDIRRGSTVLTKGFLLDAKAAGLAAMAGRTALKVFDRPALALMTTGSEVVPPSAVPGPGQVRNANLPMLLSLAFASGCVTSASLHVPDDLEETVEGARRLLSGADVLLAAGGISLGAYDHVAPAFEKAGVRFLFREVAMKPGKPFSFGLADGRPVFCLPGNPVSVFCTFQEFVMPALRMMSGFPDCRRARLSGTCRFTHRQKRGRTNLLRVKAFLDGEEWLLDMPPSNGSGDLMSAMDTNAIAICARDSDGVSPGDVLPFSLNSACVGERSPGWR